MNRQELACIFVRANDFKEGDLLVGGTRDEYEQREARQLLSALRLGQIASTPLVEDGVTEALARSIDPQLEPEISHLTVGELKHILLSPNGDRWARHYRNGLRSEVIAAAAKLMTNQELSAVAGGIFNPLSGEGITIGSSAHFGSRIQPNSPGDDEEEILFSILEGLAYGCGDVILGVNPAGDDLETIIRLEEILLRVKEGLRLPTRYCVLSDIIKQDSARSRTKVDVGFQSLAGTSAALSGIAGLDVEGLLELARGFDGLYFETGQGSAVTNGRAEGVDMVTLEARNYGLARYLHQQTGAWMIVNDVAGFIGPEVFQSAGQLLRACLEDSAMAKLHGLTMGLDVCSTFHMGIDPATLRHLTEQIVEQAAPAYLMAVAGNADPMLGYLTTSFREHPRLRLKGRKQVSTAMKNRFIQMGIMSESGALVTGRPGAESLYATYMKARGDRRSLDSLRPEGKKKLEKIRERGFDLGYGDEGNYAAPMQAETRLESIYRHGRRALYARIDDAVIKDISPHHLRVRTKATDRDDYLMHPQSGEIVRDQDASRITSIYSARRPQIQIVISDGLNANAINESLRAVLPPLKQMLAEAGHHVGELDVVIENGRVRAGYHVGALLEVEAIVHLIGERPGTGLNTMSAYLTYGRDRAGRSRWSPALDHSKTTAVCGIHPRGKEPAAAVKEISQCVGRMIREHCSGVEFGLNQT